MSRALSGFIRSVRCACGALMKPQDCSWTCRECDAVFRPCAGTVTREDKTRRVNWIGKTGRLGGR